MLEVKELQEVTGGKAWAAGRDESGKAGQGDTESDATVWAEGRQSAGGCPVECIVCMCRGTWQVYQMGTRAWKKFKQLDTDDSGALQGAEVKLLAEWVWCSFHPKQEPTAKVRATLVQQQ